MATSVAAAAVAAAAAADKAAAAAGAAGRFELQLVPLDQNGWLAERVDKLSNCKPQLSIGHLRGSR